MKKKITKEKSGVGKAVSTIKDNWSLAPRAVLAAIPVVGSAGSVLVEGYLSSRSEQRVAEMLASVSNKIEDNKVEIESISDELLESAILKLQNNNEKWKPRMFAEILCDVNSLGDEVVRNILLDHAAQLTDFDYLTFVSVTNSKKTTELNFNLSTVERDYPEVSRLREISLAKLTTLGLLARESGSDANVYSPTSIGSKLESLI